MNIDPEYARFLTIARCVGKAEGYAMALHGSVVRDLDVIAVPWSQNPAKPIHLLSRLIQALDGIPLHENVIPGRGWYATSKEPSIREHGRMVWTLMCNAHFGDPRYADFSVMPPSQKS